MPEYVCVPCARFVLVGIFLDQVALLVKSKESFFPFNLDAAINSYGITWRISCTVKSREEFSKDQEVEIGK